LPRLYTIAFSTLYALRKNIYIEDRGTPPKDNSILGKVLMYSLKSKNCHCQLPKNIEGMLRHLRAMVRRRSPQRALKSNQNASTRKNKR